jgi:tetratricopeptide (TPR) repeat protein
MKLALLFLLAAATPKFEITDARDKKPSGVTIQAGTPDADGWFDLKVTGKPKTQPILVWPYDGRAKQLNGPGDIPAIVIERGDPKAITNPKVVTAILVGELLGKPIDIGIKVTPEALDKAEDYLSKGVGLLYRNKPADAVDPLGKALRERERVMTQIPSDIYPAAMLYGKALMAAGKFDDAALAFMKATKQRASDQAAKAARGEALVKAGKAEAARELLERP